MRAWVAWFVWMGLAVLVAGQVISRYATPREQSAGAWETVTFGVERSSDHRGWAYQDFAAHLAFCREVWRGTTERPYTVSGQKEIYRAWLGELPPAGMPPAYAPTVFWLARFFLLFSPAWAYGVFVAVSLGLLTTCWVLVLRPAMQEGWDAAFIGLPLFSLAFFMAVALGQTAPAITALMGLGWWCCYDASTRQWKNVTPGMEIVLAMGLWMLSAKPNLAATFGFLLLSARLWRPVVGAVLIFVLGCFVLDHRIGGGVQGLIDYGQVVGNYNEAGIGGFFAPLIVAGIYTNLQGFLVQVTPWSPQAVGVLSYALWGGCSVAMVAAAWFRRAKAEQIFPLVMMTFLLFCPSVNATEDMGLALVAAFSPFFREHRQAWLKAFLLFVAVNGSQKLGLLHGTAWESWPICFPAKLALAGWLIRWTFTGAGSTGNGDSGKRDDRRPAEA